MYIYIHLFISPHRLVVRTSRCGRETSMFMDIYNVTTHAVQHQWPANLLQDHRAHPVLCRCVCVCVCARVRAWCACAASASC